MKLDLAGAMVWSIDTDDFQGDCVGSDGGSNYPLMRTISKTITDVLQERREQEQRSTTTPPPQQEKEPSGSTDSVRAAPWLLALLLPTLRWH